MNLYLTADKIAVETGGGVVTKNELLALRSLGETQVISRDEMKGKLESHWKEPWCWDQSAVFQFGDQIKLAHLYAGTFGASVRKLKENGAKVVYTVAAHSLPESRAEHERFGIPFAQYYPHLCEPELWRKYIEGYRLSDVIVCPSTAAMNSVRAYGGEFETKRIEIIPHGVDLPKCKGCNGQGGKIYFMGGSEYDVDECLVCKGTKIVPVAPLPKTMRYGYLGSFGYDKGIIYLLRAWQKLNYSDATLVLGGRDSQSEGIRGAIEQMRLKNVVCVGWVKNVADFYNSISCYIQPSCTEGFGIEVLEAMVHGRPVICSEGAGAADIIENEGIGDTFPVRDVNKLAELIDDWKGDDLSHPETCRRAAAKYTWDTVRSQYVKLWKEMLG